MDNKDEVRFTLRYPSDYGSPALEPLEGLVELDIIPGNRDDDRASEFDSSLHSATTVMDALTWVAASGAGTVVARALKEILVEYLKQRNRSVELTVGKKKISLKGPLSKREIIALIEPVLDK